MLNYAGLIGGDAPIGKFGYNIDVGPGPEIYNFAVKHDVMYGYAPVNHATINITKLGAARNDDFLDGATVVWTASWPGIKSRRFIVGWYEGARVYRRVQERSGKASVSGPTHQSFNTTAPADRCRLLHRDERTFSFQPMTTGRPGHAPAFYPALSADPKWLAQVRAFVADPKSQPLSKAVGKGWARQADPELRKRIEKAAVARVRKHYEDLGYRVVSREVEGVGWDLDASKGDLELCIEVKGVHGSKLGCEVTHNEYGAMLDLDRQPFYRLCVVTEALSDHPTLRIFGFDKRTRNWTSETGEVLECEELTAARFTLSQIRMRTDRG